MNWTREKGRKRGMMYFRTDVGTKLALSEETHTSCAFKPNNGLLLPSPKFPSAEPT